MPRERNMLWEAVRDGEAQATLVLTRGCSRHRKKAVFVCLVNRQVRFVRVIQVIIAWSKTLSA